MFASLPMYARPWNREAHDALWALIRDGLRDRGEPAPDALDHQTLHSEGWARPDLTLGQICNLPLRAEFWDRVTRIGSADYGLEDTPPGHYHSVFVVRMTDRARAVEDCTGYRLAYNEPLSHSGWGAPQQWIAKRGITLSQGPRTGSHRGSMSAVIEGMADLAAIDAISLRTDLEHWPPASGLRIVGRTGDSPGMTFITGRDNDPAPFAAAIAEAIADLPARHRDVLGLQGIVRLPETAYDLPFPPAPEDMAAAE